MIKSPLRGAVILALCVLTNSLAGAQAWMQYATPEEAGFSGSALQRLHRTADSLQSGGVFIVYRGRVLAAWGDVSRKLQLHSVRKSLTSILYGTAVADRSIDLNATLQQLRIDDTTRLTDAEKRATVKHVISARSGVFLPAAYAPDDQDASRPPRGSHAPGTHWMYNNWDFNVAEAIYQRGTGLTVYDGFARRIATPIGMEDFKAGDGFLAYEPRLSLYPAHTWRMSARDLARVGQLMLQRGMWNDRQILSADWVRESTTPHSDLGNGRGYGYMWWTYAKGSYGDRAPTLNRYASFAGSGTGGQAIIVVPEAELVVVHRGDTDHNRNVSGARVWGLVEGILAAKTGEAKSNPSLVPVTPIAFTSQLPAEPEPKLQPMSDAEVSSLVGNYDIGQAEPVRVTAFRGKPYVYMPGRGDAEIFRVGDGQYTLLVVSGVNLSVTRDASGAVSEMTVRMGPQTIRARRMR
jgi:CubicO group peptidase (beta-lactamase class C family)